MEVDRNLQVTRSNNKYFIWNPADIATVRKQYRLLGTLIGLDNSPPLLLTKYETRLLLELDAAVVSEVAPRAVPEAVAAATDRFSQHQKEAFESFSKLCFEEKVARIKENESAILCRYRERNDVGTVTDEDILKQKISRIEAATFQSMPVQMFAESPFHEFKVQVAAAPTDIAMSRDEEVKFQAFKQVWAAGYFLTPGTNFACDFLVYEHDPVVCHAAYMLFCRETEEEMSALEILLKGRLSVQVAKEPVFAVVRLPPDASQSADISFIKLVWEGKRSVYFASKSLP